MAEKNRLSLGIAVYNSSAYLSELFTSLEYQKVLPDEIIFVDDASSDSSLQMVQNFIATHPHITIKLVVNQKNLGISETYNKIVQLCTHEWVQILDADDYLMKDYYFFLQNDLQEKKVIGIISGLSSNSKALRYASKLLSFMIPRTLPSWLPILGTTATRSGVIYKKYWLLQFPFITPIFDGSDIIHLDNLRVQGTSIYNRKSKIYYRLHSSTTQNLTQSNYLTWVKQLKYPKKGVYWFDFLLRKRLFRFIRTWQ